ncbi:MAG: hypothetical protein HOP36_10395 [Methyloglobulus sp.]|nr:hypothetical protein [Methyloglobulus sp.]
MAKRKQEQFIKGTASHRRTESDYMGVLLDAVSLEDWRSVVTNALNRAKTGDASARAWLAQYLVGRPDTKAPSALTVVVQQLLNENPVVNKLANPVISQYKYPSLHEDDALKDKIKGLIALELAEKVNAVETPES